MDSLNVDEMVAQLLVSEGFATLEEVAYVDADELASIDGFDQNTAEELQARARESLEEINAKALEHARELGVEQSLFDFEGLTPQMIERLAEDGIMTLEEFARCADWELAGGYTTVDGKRVKDEGLLEKFDMSLEEAQTLVMNARVQLGWVDPADLVPPRPRTPARTRRRRSRPRRTGPEPMTRGGRVKERDEPERRCIVTRRDRAEGGADPLRRRPRTTRSCPTSPGGCPGAACGSAPTPRCSSGRRERATSPARRSGRSRRRPTSRRASRRCWPSGWSSSSRWRARRARRWRGSRRPRRRSSPARRRCCLQAADGSARERAQLRPPAGENTLVTCLFGHELGVAFARDRVIHAAVLAGGLGDRIRDDALRLSGIRDVTRGTASADAATDGLAGEGPRGKG